LDPDSLQKVSTFWRNVGISCYSKRI
jgi:hypothetical protein